MSYNINIVQTLMAQVVSVLAVIQVFQVSNLNYGQKIFINIRGKWED